MSDVPSIRSRLSSAVSSAKKLREEVAFFPPRTRVMGLLFVSLLPLLFLSFGIDGLQTLVRLHLAQERSMGWKATQGRIIMSDIGTYWVNRKPIKYFNTTYEYKADSGICTGSRTLFQYRELSFLENPRNPTILGLVSWFLPPQLAFADDRPDAYAVLWGPYNPDPEALQNQFPKNSSCTVYFDPADPKESVLIRPLPESTLLRLFAYAGKLISLVVGLTGFLFVFYIHSFPRVQRRNKKRK